MEKPKTNININSPSATTFLTIGGKRKTSYKSSLLSPKSFSHPYISNIPNFNLLSTSASSSTINLSSSNKFITNNGNNNNNYDIQLDSQLDTMPFLSSHPISSSTTLQTTPLISQPTIDPSLLFNLTTSASISTTPFNLTLTPSLLSPPFSSPDYKGIPPSPCTSPPYPSYDYFNPFISLPQSPLISSTSSTTTTAAIATSKAPYHLIHDFLNPSASSIYPQPELYYPNLDPSLNRLESINSMPSLQYRLTTSLATPRHVSKNLGSLYPNTMNSIGLDPLLTNINSSTSQENYSCDALKKTQLITPKNISSNVNRISINRSDDSTNIKDPYPSFNPVSYIENSPFLSPLENITNKNQPSKDSPFISIYNQFINNPLQSSSFENENEISNDNDNNNDSSSNIINPNFYLNSNYYLNPQNDLSIQDRFNPEEIKDSDNISNVMNINGQQIPFSLISNNSMTSTTTAKNEDSLENPLNKAFQKKYSSADDVNQLLFSDPFLTSISNNDEINLINGNGNGNNTNNNNSNCGMEIDYGNNEKTDPSIGTFFTKDNVLFNESRNQSQLPQNSMPFNFEDQNTFLENLNKELEDSLNTMNDHDLLFSSNSLLGVNGKYAFYYILLLYIF